MAPQPQRRTDAQRKTHLDASVVPVERALNEQAKALEQMAMSPAVAGSDPADAVIMARMATEFRALAEELHYW